jgi:hypothetical protein
MAYLDFRAAELSGSIGSILHPRQTPSAEPEVRTFTALEWLVVALAERDTMASLRVPGRLAVAMGRLFGSSDAPRLADPRLEALRRVAVIAWHRGFDVPQSELAAFHDAGFSVSQAEVLLQSVLGRRGETRRGRRTASAMAA